MSADQGVAPGERTQFRNVMWVVEKAHVEDQIGISRYAVTIRKRRDENTKTDGSECKMAGQQALQFGGSQVRGIDHDISAVAQGRNHSAFEPDSVHDGPVSSERVGPTRLGIAPFEPLVITVDKQHLEIAVGSADHVVEGFEHALDGKASGTQISAYRDCRRIHCGALDQSWHEGEGQVVEGLITHVFECLQRRRSPRPRHSGDQEDAGAGARTRQARTSATTLGHHHRSIAGGDGAGNAQRASAARGPIFPGGPRSNIALSRIAIALAWTRIAMVTGPPAAEYRSGRRLWRHPHP